MSIVKRNLEEDPDGEEENEYTDPQDTQEKCKMLCLSFRTRQRMLRREMRALLVSGLSFSR